MNNLLIVLDSQSFDAARTDDFSVKFNAPINLGTDQWEVALAKLNLWYSWFNISAALGNNVASYFNGAINQAILIPDGQYSIDQINSAIHAIMKANGDYTLVGSTDVFDIEITPNFATNKVNIQFTGGYTLDLSVGGLYLLLGSDPVVVSTSGDLPYNANITNDVDSIWARCSIIGGGGSFLNSETSDIIYTFVPNTIPNSNINIEPIQLLYIPVVVTNNIIREIRVRITDNLGRRLDLNGEPVSFTLQLRRVL